VTCHNCRAECRRFGKRKGGQGYQCCQCRKLFIEARDNTLDGVYTSVDAATKAPETLVEGCSVSTVERITGIHHTTLLKLLVVAGERCEKLLGRLIVNAPVTDVQCDEIWGFVRKKEAHKRPTEENDNSIGDAYTFVAIERHTKLVLNFALGRRDQATTDVLIEGLRAATAPQRFQLSTDGFQPYRPAITTTLSDRCDFAQLIKVYVTDPQAERRYSPPDATHTERVPVMGDPAPKQICTPHVERQNLTLRMQMRRLTRLTNGFSKKWENLWAALCLHFAWYNFVRRHQSPRVTPAMEAGIADHMWTMRELLEAA
jgi:IS1 family transposase/transposase-like protein